MKIDKDRICRLLDRIAELSLYILVFTLPFAKSVIEITIVTALIAVVLKKALKKDKPLDFSAVNVLLAIFLIASALSLINTEFMKLSLRALFSKSLKFAALFLIVKEIINTRKKLEELCVMALISCGIVILDGLFQYYIYPIDILHSYPVFARSQYSLGAPTASFPFPNDYAAWLIMFIFPVGIYAFFARGGIIASITNAVILIGLLYSLVLTNVRGALVGFFTSIGLFSMIRLKKIGAVLFLVLLAAFFLINISRIPQVLSMKSMEDRGVIWQNSWEIFKKHPVIGNGLNTFYAEYMKIRNDEYRGIRGSYAHNCYLQMASDTGITGLTAFLAFIAAVLIKGFRAANRMKDPLYYSVALGIALGLVAFLIHSSVDTNLYSLPLAALFWMSAGLLMAVAAISEQEG
ncbi:MAG: O-antigen ligase family protein [Candidatus Omnitrophica bacterium]|nr:O-antigen ligase family protein [Candidatus Omnitrophota bacterium]